MEFLIWVKFGKGMFPNAAPPEIVWGWTIAVGLFVVWAVAYYGFINKGHTVQVKSQNKKTQ